MKASSFLQDIISSILDRGTTFGSGHDDRPIEELCRELLSSRGEVSSNRIGAAILDKYAHFDRMEKLSFFMFLTERMDLSAESVEYYAKAYNNEASADNLEKLISAAEPPRQELLRRLNHVPGATATLVAMRQDLLELVREQPTLGRADLDFAHLLTSWFNRGFLVLRPISWETPANILAKIIQYEAVHAINDWDDLRRRLQPGDRRCFAFFHPSMPDEPLVFVEVALCKGIPSSVQEVLRDQRAPLQVEEVDTAVFYSISNCQKGLKGISFGNSLIKQVVTDLALEMANLKTFVTLSPIPGLARWLQEPGNEALKEKAEALLSDAEGDGSEDGSLDERSQGAEAFAALAARYLTLARREDGLPHDPVARFHLGNGASVYNVHANADTSDKGRSQSFGTMVNYLYDPSKVEQQHEELAREGTIHTSNIVRKLAASRVWDISAEAHRNQDA